MREMNNYDKLKLFENILIEVCTEILYKKSQIKELRILKDFYLKQIEQTKDLLFNNRLGS